MSATKTPPRVADDPEVRAALDRVSAVIQRALERVVANEERAARRRVAEAPPGDPPDGHKKGAAPSNATPECDVDLTSPDQRVLACPLQY